MEAKFFKNLMQIKYKWTWWLSRLEFWVRHTILITHQDPWELQDLTFCGNGGICGDLFFCTANLFHKILPQLSYINQKVYRNVPKVGTKVPTFSREINKCMFQLFRLSFLFVVLFFQYLERMFQLLGVRCSNYWDLKWVELSCLLIQQLSVESKKLDL